MKAMKEKIKVGDLLEAKKNVRVQTNNVKKGDVFKISDTIDESDNFKLYILRSVNKEESEPLVIGTKESDVLKHFELVSSKRVRTINRILYEN